MLGNYVNVAGSLQFFSLSLSLNNSGLSPGTQKRKKMLGHISNNEVNLTRKDDIIKNTANTSVASVDDASPSFPCLARSA